MCPEWLLSELKQRVLVACVLWVVLIDGKDVRCESSQWLHNQNPHLCICCSLMSEVWQRSSIMLICSSCEYFTGRELTGLRLLAFYVMLLPFPIFICPVSLLFLQAISNKDQHSISYTLSRVQMVVVEYTHDSNTDMFQVVRTSLYQIFCKS